MNNLEKLCKLIRYNILTITTKAGTGHPTSSLSAVELMTTLFFGAASNAGDRFLHYNPEDPHHIFNDRIIFSKGHASPLYFSLFHAADLISDTELMGYRQFTSNLEGHPTPRFKYADVSTGSLGQGLSIGVGMSLGIKLHLSRHSGKNSASRIDPGQASMTTREPKVFVLLGDSEVSEGQVWEALEIASHYKLNNLIGILDVNRLGQRGETMLGWDLDTYRKRAQAFGWETIVVEDGHNLDQVSKAFKQAVHTSYALSYLMGARNITVADLDKLQIEVAEKVSESTYKIKIPIENVDKYVRLVEQKMENGFWNEVLGAKIQMVFKHTSGKIEKFILNEKNAGQIYPMMFQFNKRPVPPTQNHYKEVIKDWANGEGADGFYINYFKPKMIIAKTKKGKGVSFFEDKDEWHGKPLPKDKLATALKELGDVDKTVRGVIEKNTSPFRYSSYEEENNSLRAVFPTYSPGTLVATREAYGEALVLLGEQDKRIIVLDAEVSNSTFSDKFKSKFPDRFFEMYIAEQNMISVALGLSKLGFIPYASSFAAFLTRAFDQIRMSMYSEGNVKMAGSHAGVSIGYDGSSQMGLEDLSMFRSLLESTVFYPSDAVSTRALVAQAGETQGIVYIRTTREKTPVLYDSKETFTAGGSKVLKQNDRDIAVVIAAGITLHEALKAYEQLQKQNLHIAVVDLYSVKPIDAVTLNAVTQNVKNVIVVEDHYPVGGLGDAVLSVLNTRHSGERSDSRIDPPRRMTNNINFIHLCVRKIPHSGSPAELLNYEEIDAAAIVKTVKKLTPISHPS